MECLGPQGVLMLLDWLKERLAEYEAAPEADRPGKSTQTLLFRSAPYQEDAPAIRSAAELDGTLEHLEYAVHRRFSNQLTRAERARLDNTLDNALFKVDRYLARLDDETRGREQDRVEAIRRDLRDGRERLERQKDQARRADLKLAQIGSLTPEGFEEFVAEVFEALGYEVERTGGTGDQGVDLRVRRAGLLGIVQCKYHSRGVVGSPDLQKFLGSIQHTRSHKGFFVCTRTFSLAAEKFAAEHPIELIDGPRLVELVEQALGPVSKRDREPVWF